MIATLARKTIALPNVAQNLIQHWAGAVNINAARVPRKEDYFEKCSSVVGLKSNNGGGVYQAWDSARTNSWNELGCWPANVILQHKPSCQEDAEGWSCDPSCPCGLLRDKARYFKQCEDHAALLAYLQAHLSPPTELVPIAPEDPLWDPEPGCPGLVVPWPVKEEALRRWLPLLRPGAHVVILSEDGIDVGCDLEEAGYEIRDAILLVEEMEGVHYCPKASARERNAGVPYSQAKMKVVRYFPTEEIDTECPPEGFPEEEVPPDLAEFFVPREVLVSRRHSNHHATVKPLALMSELLAGLPLGCLVVDPFLGSGTTAVAALNRGLSCIGIERDVEEGYARIALARVDFWCSSHVRVRSDVELATTESELWH